MRREGRGIEERVGKQKIIKKREKNEVIKTKVVVVVVVGQVQGAHVCTYLAEHHVLQADHSPPVARLVVRLERLYVRFQAVSIDEGRPLTRHHDSDVQ